MVPQTLNYKVEGSGPKVAFLHPAGLDLTSWEAVVTRLLPRFRILRLDLAGHGVSPPARPGMTLADYAADVHHTLKQANFLPTAIVGLSVGGMIAQELTLAHPEAVSRLVVAGCPATLPPEARPVLAARGSAAIAGGMEAIVEETLHRWFTPAFLASGGAEAVRVRLLTDDPAGWNAVWEAISQLHTAPRLHQIAMPTLCIAGAHDPASPPAALHAIAERIAGAQFQVLENAPHMMQLECPDDFVAAIRPFLEEMRS